MEIREVPELSPPKGAAKSSSHRSRSSSSRGSVKGAVGAKKIKNSGSEEQKAPVNEQRHVSPERPPRPFLKTSFGQRLSAQCGSLLFDSNLHQPYPTSVSTSRNPDHQAFDGGGGSNGGGAGGSSLGTGSRSKLRLIGNSHSASGRGSSGLSEVDVKGMALVATAAEVPTLNRSAAMNSTNNQQQQQALKLWGFQPGAIPKHRAIAMVGQVATSSRVSTDTFSFLVGSKRDGSPLRRASVEQPKLVKDDGALVPKVEDDHPATRSELELEDARKEVVAMASSSGAGLSGRLSHKSLTFHVKAEAEETSMEAKPPLSSSIAAKEMARCSTDLHAAPLSTAADSEAPTAELATHSATKPQRSSFKNDCGFLKLLPSKRKFSLEEHDQPLVHKPAAAAGFDQGENAAPRLSSNSSSGNQIARKSLMVHLAERPKSVTNLNVDSSSKERRASCSAENFNSATNIAKPVVGSFMKWMIDVGKGLAKKRCFGSEATAAPESSELSPLGSPEGGELRRQGSSSKNNDMIVVSSSRLMPPASGNERAVSPQSMDCTEEEGGGNLKEASSEMHISGDEDHPPLAARQEKPTPFSPDSLKKTDGRLAASGDGHEGGNSTNATEGTTRSSGPRELLKDGRRITGEIASKARCETHLEIEQEQQRDHTLKDQNQAPQAHKHDEQQHDVVSKSKSGGEEASFGMWQVASHHQKNASKLQRSATGNRSKARNLAAAAAAVADGSANDECATQGMAEFVASMATVKNWVASSFKSRDSGGAITIASSNRPCSFCGLKGHSVVECSETLECELKELERRALVLEDMSTEVLDLPCLRCLAMGHLGAQCRFSVTEAASRARENSELRNWRFTAARRSIAVAATAVNSGIMVVKPSSENPSPLPSRAGIVAAQAQTTVPASNAHHEEEHRKVSKDLIVRKNEESPKEMIMSKKGGVQKPAILATPASKRKGTASGETLPTVPKEMLAAIESVRLSRSELWRWVESPDFNTHVRGFFLRLRFGRWEKDLGGTGYRMARIRGAIRKAGGDEKNMSVSVDLGDMECTVDSQYVSNHSFTEVELVEWWRGRWKAGKRLITEAELHTKLTQRQTFFV